MAPLDEDAPLSPQASLALIADEQQAASRRLDVDPALFLAPWGVAWLVGYGLLFLRHGPDDRVLVSMPTWLPLAVLYVLLVGAGIVSSIAVARATRGVAGVSAERGTMYVWSWFVAFAGFGVLGSAFEEHLPDAQFGLLMGALPVFITGILYMSGGAVWHDRHQFRFGVWLSVVNAGGVLAGPGWHSLVVSLLGGGAMLVSALYLRLHRSGPAPLAATAAS
jgi:hypothetical protein